MKTGLTILTVLLLTNIYPWAQHLDVEGNAQISGELKVTQNSLFGENYSGDGMRMFWNKEKGVLRAGGLQDFAGKYWDLDSLGMYSVAIGRNQRAKELYTAAIGGDGNVASGFASFVGGGTGGEARGSKSSLVGGQGNRANGSSSFIGGGNGNTVWTGFLSAIGGGGLNFIDADYAGIIAGSRNQINGDYSFIGGGQYLTAYSAFETVFGQFNEFYSPISEELFESQDRLFVVANGTNDNARSNAFTILKNGKTGIGTSRPKKRLDVKGQLILRDPSNNPGLFISPSIDGAGASAELVIQSSETSQGQDAPFHISRNAEFFNSSNSYRYVANQSEHASKIGFTGNGHLLFSTASADTGTVSFTDHMVLLNVGRVGIGTVNPNATFEVVGNTFGAYSTRISNTDATPMVINRAGSDGSILDIHKDDSYVGGLFLLGGNVSYNSFTGSHIGSSSDSFRFGEIVSVLGISGKLSDHHPAEPIYAIQRSSQENSPNVLGAYFSRFTENESHKAKSLHSIMAVGNGMMWVTEGESDIRPGDLLITSKIKGHAMKDEGNHSVSHIIAKSFEHVKWSEVNESFAGKKRALVHVTFEQFDKVNNRDLQQLVEVLLAENAELKQRMNQLERRVLHD